MLRLAHRVLSTPDNVLTQHVTGEQKVQITSSKKLISQSTCVIADNVASYIKSWTKSFVMRSELKNIALPLRYMFIEWEMPERGGQMGFQLFQPGDEVMDLGREIPGHWKPWVSCPNKIIGTQWLSINGKAICNGAAIMASLDDKYGFVDAAISAPQTLKDILQNSNVYEQWISHITWGFAVAMFTVALMNCKNVQSVDVTETDGPGEKWLRRQHVPKLEYHILNINPMKEVLRTEGGIEHNGLDKALHICRGHFATYTPEKPLFGRTVGTFWVPQHVRGKAEHGMVIKDYSVSAPKGA